TARSMTIPSDLALGSGGRRRRREYRPLSHVTQRCRIQWRKTSPRKCRARLAQTDHCQDMSWRNWLDQKKSSIGPPNEKNLSRKRHGTEERHSDLVGTFPDF